MRWNTYVLEICWSATRRSNGWAVAAAWDGGLAAAVQGEIHFFTHHFGSKFSSETEAVSSCRRRIRSTHASHSIWAATRRLKLLSAKKCMEKVVGVNYRQKNEVHCSTKCCGTQALKCVPVTVGHVTGLAGGRLTALGSCPSQDRNQQLG